MTQAWQLQVDRSDLNRTRIVTSSPDVGPASLAPNEVRFQIDSFAMTANNITYAVFGDAMSYWQFFPAAESTEDVDGWGVVPVWGFADVEHSNHPEIKAGDRYYGYWPSGSHLTVLASQISPNGFVDRTPHRSKLPAVYNSYSLTVNDPGYDPESEGLQSLLRPLFTTSFFIDDYLAASDFFGAEQVLIASASSKTALALAFCLDRRGIPSVGLTSPGNVEFVRGVGWYENVLTYDQVADTNCPSLVVPSVYVDMSGDSVVRSNIHHFCADLRFDLMVGATHWDSPVGDPGLPGPAPEFFFAPTQIAQRVKDWGSEQLATRIAASWQPLIEKMGDLLALDIRGGPEACEAAYLAALSGTADPSVGVVITT